MPLQPSTKLGPYEILSPAGAGGMGEVYKALDTRLDRTVAVKVLPSEAAGREDLRERFEREARAVSNLNHPNICALYDVGHHDGIDYIVMEFLEGETLAARLERGPLGLDELLRVATQIADALTVAHKSGMVHRDLKPGNIMLTPGGAKLLDFGLAKGFGGAPASELTSAPTATTPLTAQGTIIGTYQYMAPEQLEGAKADARSDIFAFGAVLYEMCSGRRPFEGKTQAGLIASIIKEEPRSLSELVPTTPPGLQRLVSTCLEKNPDDRRQTMNDVLLDLRWVRDAGSQAGVAVPVSKRRKNRERIAWALAALGLLAAAGLGTLWLQATSRPPEVISSSILAGLDLQLEAGDGLALSPDGKKIVFVARRSGEESRLWLRHLDRPEVTEIAGTKEAYYPFWSPDSRHLGFFAQTSLKRVDTEGGSPRVLTSVTDARGGTWTSRGEIIYSPNFRGGLRKVPAAGGVDEPVTEVEKEGGVNSHRFPSALPDGRHVLFLAQTQEGGSDTDDASRIDLLDLETGERKALFRANSSVQYVASGHILFWSQSTLFAQPFDAGSLALSGEIFGIVDGVLYTGNEFAVFSASDAGHLIYLSGEGGGVTIEFAWLDRSGQKLEGGEPLLLEDNIYSPELSSDGTRLLYEKAGDVWVMDLNRRTSTRLTFDAADEYGAIWGPGDTWILYAFNPAQGVKLMRKRASGVGDAEMIHETPEVSLALDWKGSPGKILYREASPETSWDLWLYDVEEKKAEVLIRTPFSEHNAKLSRDGLWLLYSSDESGRPEIYVLKLTEPGGRWQISVDGGTDARWSKNDTEVLFIWEGQIFSVDVVLGEELKAGAPVVLFEAAYDRGSTVPYDITADGERIIMALQPERRAVGELTLIQNWLEAVQK